MEPGSSSTLELERQLQRFGLPESKPVPAVTPGSPVKMIGQGGEFL